VPKQLNRSGDRLSFDQSYTLNDFHFDQNSVYGDNRIAGIPIHVYQAQLLYESPLGFYAGPNLQCNLSRYPVDAANTLFGIVMCCLVSVRDFDGPTGSQSLSIAGT